MLACDVLYLVCVAVSIYHTCFHTPVTLLSTILCHTPGTWNILDQQREQVLLDYNSALLFVTDLCARYTYYSLFAFEAPQILQISTEKGLCNLGTTASQVSRTSRRLYRPLLVLVRTLEELGKTLPLATKSDTTTTT